MMKQQGLALDMSSQRKLGSCVRIEDSSIRWSDRGGFTLIELSIVLVVIGLVVGGVLVGADLIEAAKMRKQISDLEKLDAAVNTFRLKYNALPGDIATAKATTFGLPTTGSYANADKRITYYTNSCSCSTGHHSGVCVACSVSYVGEPHHLFLQLDAAGLTGYGLENDANNLTTGAPRLTLGDGYFKPTTTTWGKNGWFLGMGSVATNSHFLSASTPHTGVGSFTTLQAMSMDTKFDDGAPETGGIRPAYNLTTWGIYEDRGPDGGQSYARNCVTGSAGSRTYDLATAPTENDCQLWVQGNW